MIRAGVGLGRGWPTGTAASEAARAAMRGAGGDSVDLAIVFATPDHFEDEHALLGPLAATTRARVILGCSASGVIAGNEEVERESAVAVMVVSGVEAESFIEPDSSTRAAAIGAALGQRAEGATALVILPDVLTLRPRNLLGSLAGNPGAIVGAAASGVGPGPTTWQIGADRVLPKAVAGARIDGVKVAVGLTHAARPLGPRFSVTGCEGNVIFTLDDRPAVEAFPTALPRTLADDPVRAAGATMVAIGPGTSRADHLTRAIVGIDPSAGALAIATPVEVGTSLRFAARDPVHAREDLAAMLHELQAELGGAPPAFGLYFNCASRGEGFYGVPGIDSAYIANVLGSFPLIGFFGGAEIGPSARGPELHLFTGVLALFQAPA